jgi:putative lipoprotein
MLRDRRFCDYQSLPELGIRQNAEEHFALSRLHGSLLGLAFASILFGFPATATVAEAQEDIEWRLASVRGVEVAASAPATMTIAGDGAVSGTGGCNRIGGGVEIAPPAIEFGDMFSSMMACEDDLMAQESALIKALEAAASFSVSADTLVLMDASGAELASFVREDIEWRLASVRGVEVAASAPAMIAIAGGGALSGTGGCNRIGGTVELAPPSIEFGDMFSSMMACEDDLMAQESALIEALEAAASFSVSADTLVLMDASGAEIAHFVPAEP